ncbi:MAG: hypothetical protein LC769_05920, partial [Chloroflexi bacterium]|nr:hypothetical protein [Chloroflexota bacterium]
SKSGLCDHTSSSPCVMIAKDLGGMDDSIRSDPVKMAAWLAQVHNANLENGAQIDTQTAKASESGIDTSQLRANLRLTPEQRLGKMVRAANFFASVRGTAQRRRAT